MNKAPVLSDGRICIIAACSHYREGVHKYVHDELVPIDETNSHYLMKCKEIAQAQRDADHKYYQGVIREIFEDIDNNYYGMGEIGGKPFEGLLMMPDEYQSLKSKYTEEQ